MRALSYLTGQGIPGRGRFRWVWRFFVGGGVLMFFLLLLLITQRERSWVHVETSAAEQRSISLAGTTTVTISGKASLAYVHPDARLAFRRVASLEAGNGSFSTGQSGRGFVLETPSARIVVLEDDTRFCVTVEEGASQAAVRYGSISIAPLERPAAAMRVGAGEHVRVSLHGATLLPSNVR